MNVIRKCSTLLVAIFVVFGFCSCESDNNSAVAYSNNSADSVENIIEEFDPNTKADESYYDWDGNIIVGISSEGSKQNSILIPARCEGFNGALFLETEIAHVAFEDDDDVNLDVAFMGAENIISIKLPAKLSAIPFMCFRGCSGLRSIFIPATVTEIGGYAFRYCTSLEWISFGGTSINRICEMSFSDCSSLKSVELPEGVSVIEKYAFEDCASLEKVSLSSTVEVISEFAFSNSAITELQIHEDAHLKTVHNSAFGTNANDMVVYIFKDSWCDKNRSNWDIGFGEIKLK